MAFNLCMFTLLFLDVWVIIYCFDSIKCALLKLKRFGSFSQNCCFKHDLRFGSTRQHTQVCVSGEIKSNRSYTPRNKRYSLESQRVFFARRFVCLLYFFLLFLFQPYLPVHCAAKFQLAFGSSCHAFPSIFNPVLCDK